MRDKRFVAEHRGGLLAKEQHYQLIGWACDCSQHVLPLSGEPTAGRLRHVLEVGRVWKQGNASVGDARTASADAIRVANESSDIIAKSVARSVGHAVATAHMADHALGAAWYALKAVKSAGASPAQERRWQDERLPSAIRNLVLRARKCRNIEEERDP